MRTRLDAITLKGFKTIRELDDFRPGQLTVLIGPNGAGKSNFISFFGLLKSMVTGSSLCLCGGDARPMEACCRLACKIGEFGTII